MKTETPQPIHLTDYRPVPYLIDNVDLDFRLDPNATEVRSRLSLRPNPASAEKNAPLVLDGERITLQSRCRLANMRLGRAPSPLRPFRSSPSRWRS